MTESGVEPLSACVHAAPLEFTASMLSKHETFGFRFLSFKKYLVVYLAASGINCGMRDRRCIIGSFLSVQRTLELCCIGSVVTACGILVPWPGIKPACPALQGRLLTTGSSGKFLLIFKMDIFIRTLQGILTIKSEYKGNSQYDNISCFNSSDGCSCYSKWFCWLGFPGSLAGKESACNAGDPGLIPGWGRSPGEGIGYSLQYSWASLVSQMAKNLLAMWETWVWSLGWEDPLEEGMATFSSILVCSIFTNKRGAWKATVSGVAKCGLGLSTHSVGYCGPGSAI